MATGRRVRWSEIDPWGLEVRCAEDVWAVKVAKHGEIEEHEDAIRATIRDPDSVYFDPSSTAQKAPISGASVECLHYVSEGRTTESYRGRLLIVVIKWRREVSGTVEAYVQTMHVATAIKSRMALKWRRNP